MKQEYLRQIPAVNRVLQTEEIEEVLDKYPQDFVVDFINETLDKKREAILKETIEPEKLDLSLEGISKEVIRTIKDYMAPRLRNVINATGTVLHTNLGRAVLSDQAGEELARISRSYSNLEYDLDKGSRGSRYNLVTDLLCRLTGAEDALVVNNNASAVLLVLDTFAEGQEVILSRGELVEIGGSFRMHEVMKSSGCNLVEVGSTNKTHAYDYEKAITEETAMIAKVHTSNYKIVGFSEAVENEKLVELGRKHDLLVYEDLGSGVLVDLEKYGVTHEPTVQEAVQSGVDIVSFSGDKLLGGPQAGIIVGNKEYIECLKRNHLLRALRVGKITMAALEATLKLYLDEEVAMNAIPAMRMIKARPEELQERAQEFAQRINSQVVGANARILEGKSMIGGGSLPMEKIPTWLVGIKMDNISTAQADSRLRERDYPIVCRIQEDELLIDLRTVFENQEEEIIKAIKDLT